MLTDKLKEQLVQTALKAQKWTYSPYSHYAVGAALLMDSGKIYSGTNIENAAYPTSICAERVAVFKAVSEGEREIRAVAVVTRNGASPCGSCRQVFAEFGLAAIVLIADESGAVLQETTVAELLPGAFTPEKLG